jgi:hypothetical protein
VREADGGLDRGNLFKVATLAPFGHVPDAYLRVVDEGVDPFPFSWANGHMEDCTQVTSVSPVARFEGGASKGALPGPPWEVPISWGTSTGKTWIADVSNAQKETLCSVAEGRHVRDHRDGERAELKIPFFLELRVDLPARGVVDTGRGRRERDPNREAGMVGAHGVRKWDGAGGRKGGDFEKRFIDENEINEGW